MAESCPDQLPALLLDRLRQIIPPERLPSVLSSFTHRESFGIRVNTLRAEPPALAQTLAVEGFELRAVAWNPAAFEVPIHQRERFVDHRFVAEGMVYIQNLSSMLAVHVLDPHPNEEVLDLAAAPGGKTLDIAGRMKGTGRIAAVEPGEARFFKLRRLLRLYGADHVHTYRADGRSTGRKTPGRFDRVLLDAPCSSEARLRTTEPASLTAWSTRKYRTLAAKQRALLESGFAALQPGGHLVYCTCTFAPEENEAVVDDLLRRHPNDARCMPIDLPVDNFQPGLTAFGKHRWNAALSSCVRVLPNPHMDAMFIAKIKKA